jgi:uncharacterized protein YecT (DUF1311 family)
MQIAVETLAIFVPIILAAGAAIGWLVKRRVTGQADAEDHASLERTINLNKLLREEGISLEEAKQLREEFKRSKGGLTGAEAQAVAAKMAEAEERERERVILDDPRTPFEETTVGMNIKARAELEVLEGSLAHTVQDFMEECSPARKESLIEAQRAWLEFRDRDAELASLLAEGGTLASMLYVGHQISLTEQRIKEMRLMQADANL